jgi:hypothetical protein
MNVCWNDNGFFTMTANSHVHTSQLLVWDTLVVFTAFWTAWLQKDKDYKTMDLGNQR